MKEPPPDNEAMVSGWQAQEEIRRLQNQLAEAHDELEATNSDLLQLTLELDDRVAARTRELVAVNQRLEKEVEERIKAEAQVRRHRDHLEEIVSERTAELKTTNRQLTSNLKELALSEERFRSLVTTIPDIIYRIDENGYFTFVNDAVTLLGWSPDDLIGRHFSAFILPADVDAVSRDRVLPRYAGQILGDGKAPKLFDERRTRERENHRAGNRAAGEADRRNDTGVHAAHREKHHHRRSEQFRRLQQQPALRTKGVYRHGGGHP
jgi:PAS domain-containing protein